MRVLYLKRTLSCVLLTCAIGGYTAVARAELTPAVHAASTSAYVSDAVEVPLRAGGSDRYKIVGAVRSGTAVTVLRVDTAKGYTQIRTPSGSQGWLPSTQLSETSTQGQLTSVRAELAQFRTRYADLQKHLETFSNAPGNDAPSYSQLYEDAAGLRQQLAEYRRVSADAVAVGERNKALQEQTVTLEREIRLAQQENQTLRNDNSTLRLLTGAAAGAMVLLILWMIPKLREHRHAQWRRL